MTENEATKWAEIEECLESIALDIQNRCYPERSLSGARHLALSITHSLARIKTLLDDLEAQAPPW